MEYEPTPPSSDRSKIPAWLIAAFVLLCAALAVCVVIVVAGALFFGPLTFMQTSLTPFPELTSAVTQIVETMAPTEPATEEPALLLNPEAEPAIGPVFLQRAYEPDPHTVEIAGGGTVDTSEMDMHCGYTTTSPSFSFQLSGGAAEGFLRIYFVSSGGTDTTLVVHTPDGKWLCSDNYTYGAGVDPVIEFEFGPSGEYDIWVGTHESGQSAPGNLYITQSEDNKP